MALHSTLSSKDQATAFTVPPAGIRKVLPFVLITLKDWNCTVKCVYLFLRAVIHSNDEMYRNQEQKHFLVIKPRLVYLLLTAKEEGAPLYTPPHVYFEYRSG